MDQAPTPQKGKSSFDPANSKLIDQTATSNVFVNPDGTRTAQISQDDINVKDDKGKFKPVDNNISRKADGRLHNGAGRIDASVSNTADDANLAQVAKDDKTLSFSLVGAKKGRNAQSDKNNARFTDVLDNTDLTYQVTSTQLKETIVLNATPATAPTYRFKINAGKVTPSTDADGTIVFKDKSGTVAFRIPKGVAWDSSSTELNETHPVAITLSADNKFIDVVPDYSWMATAKYPVFIDPTVDLDLGADNHATANDAPTDSSRPTLNFNGAGQLQNGVYKNVIGNNGSAQYNTQLFLDTSPRELDVHQLCVNASVDVRR